jgi:hypothetical protein
MTMEWFVILVSEAMVFVSAYTFGRLHGAVDLAAIRQGILGLKPKILALAAWRPEKPPEPPTLISEWQRRRRPPSPTGWGRRSSPTLPDKLVVHVRSSGGQSSILALSRS